jgi:hypothetical protein
VATKLDEAQHGLEDPGYRPPVKHKGWVIGGAVVFIIGLAICITILAVDHGDEGNRAAGSQGAQAANGPSPTTQQGGTTVAIDPSVPAGAIVAGDRPILPVPAGGLAALAGQRVQGNHVHLLHASGASGFWAGTDDTNRVFVHVSQGGPAFRNVGDETVTFTGTLVKTPPDPQVTLQIPGEDNGGVDLVRTQGAYVEVAAITVNGD